ncbi:MAG TPA: Lrp/AsnC ligand binding domain-containing protein [Actinomycetota bacterium]|nr:Lrp/AsnC ligand binding domain-containing protein [Actinomycetota bacterium]
MAATAEPNDFDYTGLHAFGMLTGGARSPAEVMDGLRALGRPPEGPVLWSGTCVGDYVGLVHARVESLGELQDLIEGRFWELGMRGKWALERRVAEDRTDAVARPIGTKRSTPEYIAIASVTVERGALQEVLYAVVHVPTVRGASVVFGDADLLVQLGGDDFDAVASSVEEELQAIDGIVHTSTAFSDGRR